MKDLQSVRGIVGHRLFKSGVQMLLWRVAALVLSAVGSIWAARMLGPAKMGISGFVMTGIGQIVLLTAIPPNSYLVRSFKEEGDPSARERLVAAATSLKVLLLLASLLVVAVLMPFLSVGPDWRLSLAAGVPLLLLTAMQGTWLLQAQEKQPAQYKSNFYISLCTSVGTLVFITAKSPAGIDLVIAAVAALCGLVLTWRYAGYAAFWRFIDWAELREALRHIRLSYWLYLTTILMYLYANFELPLIGLLVSVEDLGIYRVAVNLAGTANTFLTMIPVLLFPRFIAWRQESPGKLWRLQQRLAWIFGISGVACVGLIFAIGPWLFRLVYGAAYDRAALPFACLMASKFIVVVNGVFAWGLWSHSRDMAMFVLIAGTAAVSVGLNLVIIPRLGMVGAATVNILSETIILLGTAFLSARLNRSLGKNT